MVYNDPERPEIARESQDVETPPLRVEEAPHHTGRGMSFLWFYGLRGGGGCRVWIWDKEADGI